MVLVFIIFVTTRYTSFSKSLRVNVNNLSKYADIISIGFRKFVLKSKNYAVETVTRQLT